uniref:Uncharacterized protein n=2 Tax=Enterobacteriaceae TaxID=543 RepID=A0A7D3TLT0_ECOLX|nr:hypothetical protein EFNPAABL_00063 [Klebsiella pneumoniae]QJR99229.1 hypothetical protein DELFAIOC_00063 [Escherichia coli]
MYFPDIQYYLCLISNSDIHAYLPDSNTIFLLDGVNHKFSIKEYSHLKKRQF